MHEDLGRASDDFRREFDQMPDVSRRLRLTRPPVDRVPQHKRAPDARRPHARTSRSDVPRVRRVPCRGKVLQVSRRIDVDADMNHYKIIADFVFR